jgi:hypothetical protein
MGRADVAVAGRVELAGRVAHDELDAEVRENELELTQPFFICDDRLVEDEGLLVEPAAGAGSQMPLPWIVR